MTWVKCTGKIVYDPDRTGLKRRNGPGWAVAELGNGITFYYKWLLERWGIDIDVPAWQTHVTICDGSKIDAELYKKFWKKYDGQVVEFEYDINVYQFARFYALRVRCPKFDEMRKELGLKPNYPFHITVGSKAGWQFFKK